MNSSRSRIILPLALLCATAGCADEPRYETDASALLRPLGAATPIYLGIDGAVNISRGFPSEDEERSIHIDQLQGVGREGAFLRIYDATSCEASPQTAAIFDPDKGTATTKAGDYGLITNIQGTNYFWIDRQKSSDGYDWYLDWISAKGSLSPKSDRYLGGKIVVVQSADRKNGVLEPGAWRACGVLELR